jgi:hypothetical protein
MNEPRTRYIVLVQQPSGAWVAGPLSMLKAEAKNIARLNLKRGLKTHIVRTADLKKALQQRGIAV